MFSSSSTLVSSGSSSSTSTKVLSATASQIQSREGKDAEEKIPWMTQEEGEQAEKKLASTLSQVQRNEITRLNFSHFGQFFETTQPLASLKEHERVVRCLAVLKNGALATGSGDRTIKLWDTSQERCLSTLTGHTDPVLSLAVLGDGVLASGSWDTTIKLWDTSQERCLSTLTGHTNSVSALAVLGNGLLASGSYDNTIKLWDTSQERCLSTLTGHTDTVRSLAVLGSGVLASGSDDHTIKLWDTSQERCLSTLKGHTDSVWSLAVLGNGLLASGSSDNTIKLWDTSQERCLSTLTGHTDPVLSLAVLGDGVLASGSSDNTIKLWDTSQERCLSTLKGHTDSVWSLVVLGNGVLASGSSDNTIKLWKPKVVSLSAQQLLPLLEALQTNTSVTNLDLSGNSDINDEIIDPVISLFVPPSSSSSSGLRPNTTLKTIDLRKTNITKRGMEKLQKAVSSQSVQILSDYLKKLAEEKARKEKADVLSHCQRAIQGQADAQYMLGTYYLNGQGVKKDEKEAVKWFLKSAEQNYANAQSYLGWCYYNGVGVDKNLALAKEWWEKAAEQGETSAQDNLKTNANEIEAFITQEKTRAEQEAKEKAQREEKHTGISDSIQEVASLQRQIDSWRTERQQFEQKLQQLVSQQQEAKTSTTQLQEQRIIASILEQLSLHQERETKGEKLETELRLIKSTEQKLQEELARLREEVVTNPEVQARLTALEEQLVPLQEEYQERQEKLQAQQYIYQSLHLKLFYLRVQAKLNQIFLAYMALSSGKIKKESGMIELLGKSLNFLTLGLSSIIASGIATVSDRRDQKKMTQISDRFIISITATEQTVEKVVRALTRRYEEQIKELTLPADESWIKRATFTSGANGGVETLAECAVARIIDGLRDGQLRTDQSWDDALVSCVFLSHYKSGFIPFFTNKDIATLANKNWTDEGIFQRSGIKVFDTAQNVVRYYKAPKAKDPCGEPMKYGHRWGTIEEVQELKLTCYQPKTSTGSHPSSGFKAYVHTVTSAQKGVATQQAVQAKVLVQTKDRVDQTQLEVERLKKEMAEKDREHAAQQAELEAKMKKAEEEKKRQEKETQKQLEAQKQENAKIQQQLDELRRMMQSMMTNSSTPSASSHPNTSTMVTTTTTTASSHMTSAVTIGLTTPVVASVVKTTKPAVPARTNVTVHPNSQSRPLPRLPPIPVTQAVVTTKIAPPAINARMTPNTNHSSGRVLTTLSSTVTSSASMSSASKFPNTKVSSLTSSYSSSFHATSGNAVSVSLGSATSSELYQGIFNQYRAEINARHECSSSVQVDQKAKALADARYQELTQS